VGEFDGEQTCIAGTNWTTVTCSTEMKKWKWKWKGSEGVDSRCRVAIRAFFRDISRYADVAGPCAVALPRLSGSYVT
jgi:hypothetical protein